MSILSFHKNPQVNIAVCSQLHLVVLNVVQLLSLYFGIDVNQKLIEEEAGMHYVGDFPLPDYDAVGVEFYCGDCLLVGPHDVGVILRHGSELPNLTMTEQEWVLQGIILPV